MCVDHCCIWPILTPELQSPPEQRTKLIVTSGVQYAQGANMEPVNLEGEFYGSNDTPTPIYLGEARTDEEGHLVMLAGRGLSRSVKDADKPYPYLTDDFDSPDWVDDTSDGWITVEVKAPGCKE